MAKVCVLHGHPHGDAGHLCAALGKAYVDGAREAGHEVEQIRLAELTFDLLSNPDDFSAPPPEPILSEREKIAACDHLLVVFPLWLGSAPARLRGFFEQAARASFFLADGDAEHAPGGKMKGKSARLVVTMGMPGLVYKTWFGAHSLKGIEKGVFGMAGFKPVEHTIFGMVEGDDDARRRKWLDEMFALGAKAK